ncbi:hypothetical protein [Prevotella koreensis]
MEMYEISTLMKYSHYSHKDSWEQARLNAFMIAQVNSRKKLNYQDIMKFYWETETEDKEEETRITKEDIQRLNNKAQEYLEIINGRDSN